MQSGEPERGGGKKGKKGRSSKGKVQRRMGGRPPSAAVQQAAGAAAIQPTGLQAPEGVLQFCWCWVIRSLRSKQPGAPLVFDSLTAATPLTVPADASPPWFVSVQEQRQRYQRTAVSARQWQEQRPMTTFKHDLPASSPRAPP